MQHPIRERIQLKNRWQAQRHSVNKASLFVPGSWAEKQVALISGTGEAWDATERLVPGRWNVVEAEGSLEGLQMVAGELVRITSLDATLASDRSLSIRVRMAYPEGEPQTGLAEPTTRPFNLSMMTICFTLTAANGDQIGGMEVTFSRKSRDLSVEMRLPEPLKGNYRLKASLLSADDRIIDNARFDLHS